MLSRPADLPDDLSCMQEKGRSRRMRMAGRRERYSIFGTIRIRQENLNPQKWQIKESVSLKKLDRIYWKTTRTLYSSWSFSWKCPGRFYKISCTFFGKSCGTLPWESQASVILNCMDSFFLTYFKSLMYRRSLKTEEKPKVVLLLGGNNLFNFLLP